MTINEVLDQRPIQPEELDLFRKNLKIGDTVEIAVNQLDMTKKSFFEKRRIKVRVISKYPHVVVTKNTRTGREYHTTYVEILLLGRRGQYGDTAL